MILWNTLIRFEKAKVIPLIALRNTVAVALPLIAGGLIGQQKAGVLAALGALNVSYSDRPDPYRQKARRMLAAACCCAGAVAAGGLLGREHVLLVILAALAAFATGMMVAIGQTAADIGVMSLATLIVFAAQGLTPEIALQSGLVALGGGLLQTALALASWPVARYAPERRALAALYSALARTAGRTPEEFSAPGPPPATGESTQAQDMLSALEGDQSVDAERYLALLSQAERIRLALLLIARLRVRLGREPDAAVEMGILDESLAAASRALEGIAEALGPGAAAGMGEGPGVEMLRIEADAGRLRSFTRGMARDARFQLDALAGQLRAVAEMTFHATSAGDKAFAAMEAAAPPPLRLSNALARLRANLCLDSPAFRHALRLAACVALGETINRLTGAQRGYWLPMTVAIVLRPDFTGTFTRGLLRLGGTLAGLVAATALVHFLAPSQAMEVFFIVAFTFLLRCFGPANYGLFVTALTALVVFLIGITGVAPGPVMMARGVNTLAGGAIGLIAYALWPTWERNLVPESLAALLDAYRAYFGAVRDAYVAGAAASRVRLDRARLAARLARSNSEASITRLASEPRANVEQLTAYRKLLANSHRFVLAVMSLEAGLARSAPAPVRDAFRPFATAVETTLEQLAAALRGGTMAEGVLPDLRELHYELLRTGDAHFGRHALVNVESDRIVNSLNTLTASIGTELRAA
jgi:uncharacterized membrane protein YccC